MREDGADVIIVPEIADFLLAEYTQAGRTQISTGIVPVNELIVPEARTEIIRDTVPSIRLDAVTSSAFRLPRTRASEAIRSGIVSVDHIECMKPDAKLEEGAVIVMRGKGKAVLRSIGGESKKGRLWVVIEKDI